MFTNRWRRWLLRTVRPCRPKAVQRHLCTNHFTPRLDLLEDRVVPASYSVTTTTDLAILADNSDVNFANGQISDHGNAVSLRSAIIASNHTPGPNTITLPAGTYLITQGSADDELNHNGGVEQTGDFDVFSSSLTITGAGSATTIIDGNSIDRIFDVQSPYGTAALNGITFNLSGVTLRNGHAPADGSLNENGGAIAFNGASASGPPAGQLILNNVVLKNNTAEGAGGALYAQSVGAMTLTNVTFDSNTANHGSGGAISYQGGASDGNIQIRSGAFTNNKALDPTLGSGGAIQRSQAPGGSFVVQYSSFSGNQAGTNGGALSEENAGTTSTLRLTESTVAGNSAGGNGGGVYINDTAGGIAALLSDTVTNNRANTAGGTGVGGGIDPAASGVTLVNTIVAGNFKGASGSTGDDAQGTLSANSSYNLFGTGGSANLTSGNTSHNLFNVANAGLGPLADYGGSTLTVPLLAGSPALDAGANPDASNTDQRFNGNFVRVVDLPSVPNATDGTDIGAFESRGFSLTLVGSDSESTTVTTQFPNPLKVGVTARDTNVPVDGALVTYTGPVTTTGATIYPNPTSATVSSGIASATVYANFMSSPTSYTVLASLVGGVNTVPFHLTNTPAQPTDLAVTIVGPPTALAGTDVTYTITVKNNGPNDAQNVTLADTLPGNRMSFGSQSQTSGPAFTLSNTGNVISDTIATLTANATAIFTVTAHILASVPNNTQVSDTATVTLNNPDPNLSNNGSTANTLIGTQADLMVTKTGPATAITSTNLSYTISVTNNGPSDAQGAVLGDTLPTGETFVSLTQTTGPTFTPGVNGNTFSEFISTLASGASASFTVVAGVNANIPNNTVLNNTATVSNSTTDPNLANNTSTAATRINPLSNLAVTGATAHLVTGQSAVDGIILTFNESIQAQTFTTAAVDSLTGPGGNITPSGVTPLSPTQFEVTFAAQTTPGTYTLVIGPYVTDLAGNPMDQNGDGIGGEDPADRYTTTFGLPLPAALPFQENFDDGVAHAFISQSGAWTVNGGRYGATPTTIGDAVTLLPVSGTLPSSLELDVTMNATAGSGSFFSNGFVVFDYQSPTNFKYAGAFVGLQQWVVGHRDANGWNNDAVVGDSGIAPGTDYSLQLLLQGARATLLVNGASKVAFTYASGFSGSVGLGTDNSVTQFDNLSVQQYGGTLPIQENFDDGQAHFFSPQSGAWSVSAGRYAAAPTAVGADAVSTLRVNGVLPSSLEFDVTMNATAAAGNFFSNGFLVFDYQSPTSFKYAGTFVGLQQWVVGHRDASGWNNDAVVSDGGIAPGTDYSLQLLLQGANVTLLVNGVSKVGYGYASGFTGSVGLGTLNSLTQFDNLTVQQYNPPGGGTLPIQENFDDGQAHFFSPQSGSWSVNAGRYDAAPTAVGADAVSTLLINGGPPSSLEFDVTMNATAGSGSFFSNGFLVFDFQNPTNFKFAGAFVGLQRWVIGHRDANGWQVDAQFGDSGIAPGTDYNLQLLLQGNSASLLVNGVGKVNHTYSAAFSGSLGLGTQNSLTQFDNLLVQEL